MPFQKIERSYYSTPFGWRLATFDETRNGLEKIKEKNLLNKCDRVRLLDGWITGPGYNFKMGNDFKGCLGYILLIRTEASGCAYADVNICDTQKEAALFLCADDWNYEVIYWLLNSWTKTDTMDLQDVRQGRIPFIDPTKFKQMNKVVCSLARKLGDNVPVSEKAAKRTYLGSHSGKEVLSNLIKIVNEEDLQQYDRSGFKTTAEVEESCFPRSLEPYWLEHLARQGGMDWNNIADVFLNFLSESFAGSMVEFCGNRILAQICKVNDESDGRTITSSQGNFIVASLILFYASSYLTDIMHAPLAHDCWGSCAGKMLFYVASNSGSDDLPRFNRMLENNAMWRWYDQVGNYDLLNKLLVIAASGNVSRRLKTDEKNDILVVNMLLQCGAQPGSGYATLGCEKVTTLESAITFRDDEDIAKEVAKSLLHKCHREQQQQLANVPNKDGLTPLQFASWRGHALKCQMLLDHGARPDFLAKDNKTAIHFASLLGHAGVCQILLDNGAKPDVQDTDGKTVLHIAVEEKQNAVVNVLIKHPDITEVVDLKDKRGHSPLDAAVADTDMKLVATLLSKLRQPEAYFNKVDLNELLRYSLLNGCVYIVTKLFQKGTKLSVDECDDEGKTFVHLAAMGDDDSKAVDLVSILLENIEEKEKLVCNCDRIGRTALHEAALKGNEKLCRYLLDINPKVIDLKDRDGRNPLYDAVHGKQNEEAVLRMLLVEYSRKDIGLDDLRDRNGLTPLHVAASLGKKHLVKVLLSRSRNDSNQYFRGRDFLAQKASAFLKRGDFRGQTALHKAAICGDVETIGILLEEGAHPLNKRDCDGRTALHYAFQAKTGGDKRTLADFLLASCNSYEEKSLLLWASPAGLGTADENLSKDDPIRKFLVDKKREITEKMNTHNLLKTASSLGDTEMSKELVSLGYQIEDIYDEEWLERLEPTRRENVEKVSRQLDIIPERGNDRPALSDDPERIDYARGLAALFLNPYLKPPITVGISGAWGKGKSSLLVQTEVILLTTAAQMALIPSSKLPSSALEFPDMKAC
ncbi:uncharacterized protein LOC131054475 [Cryptomeria japonica]|uniref:uncharacterized protein LOC131054475 n=1 Tax=Cryptomeria japonica TaxID=3369 RepID=UPI0027D9E4B2|nr:uncharacterized protein LOC131054475 [Cryptomeria japonica]